jgi:hypothetical protein
MERFLQRWSQDATDALGWTVSSSALLRALLQYASRQPASWVPANLFPIIEQEIAAGVRWGGSEKMSDEVTREKRTRSRSVAEEKALCGLPVTGGSREELCPVDGGKAAISFFQA